MSNPWLSIPLEDYEGHMGSPEVEQISALSELFQRALTRYLPESFAILGVAGGNGLEHVDPAVTKRVIGIDINQSYLDEVRRRYQRLQGLELHCRDLKEGELGLDPVDMVHAALIFEHAGLGLALDNAVSLVAPSGTFSVVLQLPSTTAQAVAATNYASIQKVKQGFALVDIDDFVQLLATKGFRLLDHERRPLPAGKAFWFGVFARP